MSNKRRNNPQKSQTRQMSVSQTTMEASYIGPIPLAEQLEHYERICPGAAERIIAMAERQSAHRQEMEAAVIKGNVKDSRLGVWFAFILGVVTIASGLVSILHGYDLVGGIVGTAGLSSLVGVFIYGTRSSKKERENKMSNRNQN